jgi:hypothetical protein
MDDLMKLVMGWTIVGGFIFTMVITCLSLVGWVRFADPRQQKRLFSVLIVEVVAAAGAHVVGAVNLSVSDTREKVETSGANQAYLTAAEDMLESDPAQRTPPDKAQITRVISRIKVTPGTAQAMQVETLKKAVSDLPAGSIDPRAAKDLRLKFPAKTR